jgi:hypothetical protein
MTREWSKSSMGRLVNAVRHLFVDAVIAGMEWI